MLEGQDRVRFEESVLPHLDAAFNLARWLLRSRADAEDVTQEALLRAYRFFGTYRAGDARAWLLQIVRNCSYTWLQKNRPLEDISELSEASIPQERSTPESLAIASHNRELLSRALEELPAAFRERGSPWRVSSPKLICTPTSMANSTRRAWPLLSNTW